MTLEVLISCMHQKDTSIVASSNIQTDVVVVNQCDKEELIEEQRKNLNGELFRVRMFNTLERGLSKSRNMAIRNAESDICLFCDDDVLYKDDYANVVLSAFEKYPDSDVILFNIGNLCRKPIRKPTRVNYISALKVASLQIAFRRKRMLEKDIFLDESMGSGTGNGGGEEAKLIYDCLRSGLKVFSVPDMIASVDKNSPSLWFRGYNPMFLIKKGWATRKIMGRFWGVFYAASFAIRKYKEYKNDCSFIQAFWCLMNGVLWHKV